ncbi:MAG: hypothetical protein ACRCZ9_07180 [Fusobacteriaceae bacterium]
MIKLEYVLFWSVNETLDEYNGRVEKTADAFGNNKNVIGDLEVVTVFPPNGGMNSIIKYCKKREIK